jgi:hypothetical protein
MRIDPTTLATILGMAVVTHFHAHCRPRLRGPAAYTVMLLKSTPVPQ